jgi:hypothetical protein
MASKNNSRKSAKPALVNMELTLTENAELKTNVKKTPYLVARGTTKKNQRKVTVMTYVKAGIAALTGAIAGQVVRVYGTWADDHKTFSVMGLTPARQAAE